VILIRLVLVAMVLVSLYVPSAASENIDSSHESMQPEAAPFAEESLDGLLLELTKTKLSKMPNMLARLEAASSQDSMRLIFSSMLDGRLYFIRDDFTLVDTKKADDGKFEVYDALSGEALGQYKKKSLKKIRVNLKIRKILRSAIARIDLVYGDEQARREMAFYMLENANKENIEFLTEIAENEPSDSVSQAMDQAIALYTLNTSSVSTEKILAIGTLSESLYSPVRVALERVLEKSDDGVYLEPDVRVRREAEQALKKITDRLALFEKLKILFFGLSKGSVLLLVAIGLAITFGVMGVINMAHGEMIMLGAYTTYVIQQLLPNHIAYSLFLSIPMAFLVAGCVGVAIERGLIRHLHGRPLETLLATFGVSLLLQQLIRTIFSPLNRQIISPEWISGSWEINAAFSLTYNRLYILAFSLLVFFGLLLVLKKTSLGLNVRAVSQNREMAKAMGIKTQWVDALTFGLGSGIAGVAGVALSQLTNVNPSMGQEYIIDSFMVVVFGGVGNILGTMFGAFSLGVVNKFIEPVTGAVLAKIFVLVFIILFIQRRPKGLFPQKGRAAE